jgi:hypothetical protein
VDLSTLELNFTKIYHFVMMYWLTSLALMSRFVFASSVEAEYLIIEILYGW